MPNVSDDLRFALRESGYVTNIHSIMKAPSRRIHGRVEVTYANPLKVGDVTIDVGPPEAYNSKSNQMFDGLTNIPFKLFTTYDSDLSGSFQLAGPGTQVGWHSYNLSNSTGQFSPALSFEFLYSERTITDFTIVGDIVKNTFPVDFDFTHISSTQTVTKQVRGNNNVIYTSPDPAPDNTIETRLVVYSMNRPNFALTLSDISLVTVVTYDDDNLYNINVLEELSFNDSIAALGGVSANELSVDFRNDEHQFDLNNPRWFKPGQQLKRNRRLRAWLGAETNYETESGDNIEWYLLGTFWAHKWNVPLGALKATCVAFDSLGLLSSTEFIKHNVYRNASIGDLIELVILDAMDIVEGLTYVIDPELHNTIVPIAWFEKETHLSAINRLVASHNIEVFCDRQGRIVARLRKPAEGYHDTWADSTNIIYKEYDTLYTESPNTFRVSVNKVSVQANQTLYSSTNPFSFLAGETKDFEYSSIAEGTPTITMSPNPAYTRESYSWGSRIKFTNAGTVNSITITGSAVSQDGSIEMVGVNNEASRVDGEILEVIDNPYIQTEAHARSILSSLLTVSADSMYDTTVKYTGDMSLTIGDAVRLLDGISPLDLYMIRRQELFWNGGLTGSARLSTGTSVVSSSRQLWTDGKIWYGAKIWRD